VATSDVYVAADLQRIKATLYTLKNRRTAANLMTKEEARRIAANIVKLLGLLAVRMPALTQPWPPASPFQITTRRAGAD